MPETQNQNQVSPVTPITPAIDNQPIAPVTPVINAPVVQIEPLGLSGTTAHLLKLEEQFNCSIDKIEPSSKLGDLVKMASCLSEKTIPEICEWIDKYGMGALIAEFKECTAKIQEKKVSAVR